MVRSNQFINIKNVVVTLVLFASFSVLLVANAKAESRKRIYSLSAMKAKTLVAHNLSGKLQSDLFNSNIRFQVRNVEKYEVLNGQTVMIGDGYCVLTKSNDKMPLRFETIIDAKNHVKEIKYDFVDFQERSANTLGANEDTLMTALLNKLSKDYLTEDIVIAVDHARGVKRSNSRKAYTGYGEVKVKNGKWKTVEFTVELNFDNKSAKKVVYQIK